MLLYIIRHGIAIERDAPKCPPEAERFLTKDGIVKTRLVAKGLDFLGAEAALFLSSPYVRALQTAEIFASALKYSKQKIQKTELLLPGADPLAFYRDLAGRKGIASVFCFGHAPHLDGLIATGLGLKDNVTQLKKAGVALLELRRVLPPSGTLVWLATPKLLRKFSK